MSVHRRPVRPDIRPHRSLLPALALALVAGLLACAGTSGEPAAARTPQHCALDDRLVPTCPGRILAGAYISPKPGEDYVAAVARHERQTGAPMSIVRFYYTGDRRFPNEVERRALRQGGRDRLLFASWKPASGQTWRDVASGKADAMLKRQADYLRQHWDRPMYLALHHEPEDDVRPGAGSGYQARDFAAMFRHVRSVFERRGVDQAVWVMNYMGFQRWHLEPWFDQLWPGDSHVDWIAYDPYKTPRLGGFEGGYAGLVNRHYGDAWNGFYRWASKRHAGTPIMLGEWGIAERDGREKWKSVFFRRLAPKVSRTPQIRAMLYFDHDFAQAAGDVSLDTSEYSLKGYRRFLRSRVIARIG